MKPERDSNLDSKVTQQALRYVGHVVRRGSLNSR